MVELVGLQEQVSGLDNESVALNVEQERLTEKNVDLLDQGFAAFSVGFNMAKCQATVLHRDIPLDWFNEGKVVIDRAIVEDPAEGEEVATVVGRGCPRCWVLSWCFLKPPYVFCCFQIQPLGIYVIEFWNVLYIWYLSAVNFLLWNYAFWNEFWNVAFGLLWNYYCALFVT